MFSAFAMTRSTCRSFTSPGSLRCTTCRPGRPTMSPMARMRNDADGGDDMRARIPAMMLASDDGGGGRGQEDKRTRGQGDKGTRDQADKATTNGGNLEGRGTRAL